MEDKHHPTSVGALLKRQTSGNAMQTTSPYQLQRAALLIQRYGTSSQALGAVFNRSRSEELAPTIQDAVAYRCPTIADYATAFNKDVAAGWVMTFLIDLAAYSSAREKLTTEQLKDLSSMIVTRYGYYKLTEFMHFILRCKMGEFGKLFYGSVDPIAIMDALKRYETDRVKAAVDFKNAQERARREKEAQSAVTWEEYCKMRGIDPKAFNPLGK